MNRREFNQIAIGAAAAAALAPLSAHATARPQYKPKFAALWPEVDSFIRTHWDKSIAKSDELPKPFVQSSPDWNFTFYWDNYFINLGLLRHKGFEYLARNSADNLLFLVKKYGFVPNCNLSWGTNRSQPPYLSKMVREVYETSVTKDRGWLRQAYDTLGDEYRFWIDDVEHPIERHNTDIPGLQRYSHHASREDRLVFYRDVLVPRFHFPLDVSDDEKMKAVEPYLAEAASGMDFTPRFEHRCDEFAALDLNVLLYLYEINFDYFARELGLAGQPDWFAAAEKRKQLIHQYFWDDRRGLFMDYDSTNRRTSKVACCTAFMPMWAGISTTKQANRLRENLSLFEYAWGLATCEKTEQKFRYQWDYPNGWVPLHALVVGALENGGFHADAVRVASKYCDLVARNYQNPTPAESTADGKTTKRASGRLYEKYNVVTGEIADTEYTAFEGLGWTAGVFVFAHEVARRAL